MVSRIIAKFNENSEALIPAETTRANNKRQWEVGKPELEEALWQWFRQHEKDANMSGELIKEKASQLYQLMYPQEIDSPKLKFSNG